MGPLVPDIISSNLNLVVALFIGLLFGAILEQAGFSTSKKLVGLFYGYDFTVLRVFFTAGVVAMVGVMAFVHFGLLDPKLIYINPTFLWSAIIGGLIMGLGFVVGGFCPGTSICSAAIGKIDALVFIGGTFLGVLIFMEGYPLFEALYKAKDLGIPLIYDTLGIPQAWFAFIMVVFALLAFWATTLIEKRVNGIQPAIVPVTPRSLGFAVVGILLAISVFFLPEPRSDLARKLEDPAFVANYAVNLAPQDKFALCLLKTRECDELEIFDFRSPEDYRKRSLPRSRPFTYDNLFEKEPSSALTLKHKEIVFVANDELTERKMAIAAQELGFMDIYILEGGLDAFLERVDTFTPRNDLQTQQAIDENRFWTKASTMIPVLIENNKPRKPVEKKAKRVLGGC